MDQNEIAKKAAVLRHIVPGSTVYYEGCDQLLRVSHGQHLEFHKQCDRHPHAVVIMVIETVTGRIEAMRTR